ncbi:phage tail protein [Maritimibacter alexandrii]|uniref:phage tail protein n=1 Tax=Maritimibacter alexandrii TaxID=2570355 RepID=UPI001107B18C|nr:hypothetical protein [Maritimibacter alexandrii]
MSKALVGMLRAVLSLETGAFEKGADRAEKRARELRRTMTNIGKGMRNVGAVMTAAITAPAAGLTAMSMRAADAMIELDNVARMAGLSAGRFKVLSLTATRFGVEQEKLADILKDVNDRVGDFLQTGGGPMKDFFENIAPKVGITKDAFVGLNSEEALGLYIRSLKEAGVSQQEMTFYMEAMASDATLLTEMFDNYGRAISDMAAKAAELGLVLDQRTIDAARRSREEFRLVGDILRTKMQAALVGLIPVFTQLAEAAIPILTKITDKLVDLAEWFQNLSPKAQKFVSVSAAIAVALGPVIAGIGLATIALAPFAGALATVVPIIAGVVAVAGGLYLSLRSIIRLFRSIATVAVEKWQEVRAATDTNLAAIAELLRRYALELVAPYKAALEQLVETTRAGISALGDVFVSAGALIRDGLAGMVEGAMAIIETLSPRLADAVRGVASTVWEAAQSVGRNIIDGIRAGIDAAWAGLKAKMDELGAKLPQWVRDKLGIKSPSLVMRKIGEFIAEGLKRGITRGTPGVQDAISDMTDGVEDTAVEAQVLETNLEAAGAAGEALGEAGAAGARRMKEELAGAKDAAFDATKALKGVGQNFLQDLVSNPDSAFKNAWSGFKSAAGQALSQAVFNPGGIAAGFTTAFQQVSSGLSGLAAGGGLAALGTAVTGALPIIGAVIAGINLIATFSKKTQIGSGLKLGVEGGQVTGSAYDEFERTTFWGLFKNQFDEERDLPAQLARSLNRQASKVQKTVTELYAKLGISVPEELLDRVKMTMRRIETENLSANEIEARVEQMFKEYAGALSNAIAKMGAQAAEALVGVQAVLDPISKDFDLFAASSRQAGAADLGKFGRSAKYLAERVGGIEALASKTGAYFDGFFSDEEKLAYMRRQVAGTFRELGRAVPTTDEAFRALVQSQNLLTQSGRRAFTALLDIAPTFDQITDILEAQAEQAREVVRILGVVGMRVRSDLADELVSVFGTFSALTTQTAAFFETFFSQEEKLAYMRSQIAEVFADLNLALPETMAGFKALVTGQNLMTKAGREAYAALLGIAPVFVEVTATVLEASGALRSAYNLDAGGYGTAWEAKLANEISNAGRYSNTLIDTQNAELSRQTELLRDIKLALGRSAVATEDLAFETALG